MGLCFGVNSSLPDQYASCDYFSELNKACGSLGKGEEDSTDTERERTEQGEDGHIGGPLSLMSHEGLQSYGDGRPLYESKFD